MWLQNHINDNLAPKFVDIVQHINIRKIDHFKQTKLQKLKVATIPSNSNFSSILVIELSLIDPTLACETNLCASFVPELVTYYAYEATRTSNANIQLIKLIKSKKYT